MPENNEANKDAIRKQLESIRKTLADFEANFEKPQAVKDLQKAKASLAWLEEKTPGAATPMSIKAFFETVGSGLVAAQSSLDMESLEYLNNRPAGVLPSVFRIPKASAEIHFAIETTEEEGFSVIVYGASDTRQQSQQHRVSFDIVSAPPPAEVMTRIECLLITNLAERRHIQRVLSELANTEGLPPHKRQKSKDFAKEKNFRRVLAFKGSESWALFLPSRVGKEFYLDEIYLQRDGSDLEAWKASLSKRATLPKEYGSRIEKLFQFFLELSMNQANQLASLSKQSPKES